MFSHERFHEAHDLIVQAWTKPGPFEFEGDHYNFKYVNCWPRPYQQPRPQIWVPSQGSSETVKWAADPSRKYQFLVTFSSAELVTRYLNAYRTQAREFGYEPSGDQMGWAVPVYVADTDERARAEAGRAIETLFGDYLPNPWEMLLPPGYTSMSSMKTTMKLRSSLGTETPDAVAPHRTCFSVPLTHSLFVSKAIGAPDVTALTWNAEVGATITKAIDSSGTALKQKNRVGCPPKP